MSISEEEVRAAAFLARLHIDEESVAAVTRTLGDVLAMVARVQEADLPKGTTPLTHPRDARQRLRADEVREEDQRSVLQQGAPQVREGFYLVPRTVE